MYAEVVVGTAPYCQLCLPGVAGLAEVHACIKREPQGYVIADLNSPSGVMVEGSRLCHPTTMRPGLCYMLGELGLTMEAEELAEPRRVEVAPTEERKEMPRESSPWSRSEAQPMYVAMPQAVILQQSGGQQVPVVVQQSGGQQLVPQQVPVVNIVQVPMEGHRRKAAPPTHPLRQKEVSLLMANLHRRSRYNSCSLSLLWLFITAIMASGLIIFVVPRPLMQKVVEYLVQRFHQF